MTILTLAPPLIRAVQYGGANTAEVLSLYQESTIPSGVTHTIDSSDGTQVTIKHVQGSTNRWTTISTGSWLVIEGGVILLENVPNAELPSFPTMSSFADQVCAQPVFTRSFNNAAARSLVTGTGATGFRVSTTRDASVGYNITMSTTATIGGASSSTVVLEIAPTNSTTPGDWVEIARISNSQNITLAIALQSVQGVAGQLGGIIPAGYYAKLRQINTGTASASYNTGQEVLI